MWLCLNNSFLSIVAPKSSDKTAPAGTLLVRARRLGDIERIFPGYTAGTIDHRDYQFRAFIPREIVGAFIAAEITGIEYVNFKDSVKDHKLHDAYASFWHVMARLQPVRPYGDYSREMRTPVQGTLPMAKAAPRKRAVKAAAPV